MHLLFGGGKNVMRGGWKKKRFRTFSFPCDYVTLRNGYCKCVIPSTVESKHVFF